MRANASSEAGKTLKKARARGARLVSEATRLLESAKRNAAKAEGDARAAAERMLREAGKRQAEIDTAAEERLQSAKKAAGKIRADARAEADTLVNNAKEREAEIVANSQREVERLGAERQRSSKIAGELLNFAGPKETAHDGHLDAKLLEQGSAPRYQRARLEEVSLHGAQLPSEGER